MIIKNSLYKKEIEISFNSFKHLYIKDGQTIPSVTQVLGVIAKPLLVPWAARMATEHIGAQLDPDTKYTEAQIAAILEAGKQAHWRRKIDSGKRGSFIHDWIDKYIKGTQDIINLPAETELREPIEKFLKWVEANRVKFFLSEQMVYSLKYDYVGIADFICSIKGKLYLGDIKTTKAIYIEHYMQSAAYRNARVEEFPEEKYHGQIILRIGDEGIETGIVNNNSWYLEMLNAFLFALKLYEKKQKLEDFKGGTL